MLNIDDLLNLITIITWVIYGLFVIYSFSQNLRDLTFKPALQSLISVRMFLPLILIIVLNLISLSITFIPPEEIAIVVSALSPRGIREQPMYSGLHFIVPFLERPMHYPIYWQSYTMAANPSEGQNYGNDSVSARTKDGQEVSIDCTIIFKVDPAQIVRIHVDWQDRYINDLVRPLLRGLVRDFVSKYTVDEVNSDRRQDLKDEVAERLRLELEERGFVFDSFLLRNIGFTPEYATAIEEKQVALQRIEQANHEAEAIRIHAQAEAAAIETLAKAVNGHQDLLTYQYINKIAPTINTLIVPSNAPYFLDLNLQTDNNITTTSNITPTLNTPRPITRR